MSYTYSDTRPLENGGIESAASLHPAYQARARGNSSGVTRVPTSMLQTPPPAPLSTMTDVASLIAADQARYFEQNFSTTRNPTRFDIQTDFLPVGGRPMPIHRDMLGDARDRTTDTSYDVPLEQTQDDLGNIYRNPGPYDFDQAVRGKYQAPYAFPEETIQRMMRPPDEIDPQLVTNPLPDQTFMARPPMFDHAPEDAATQRWRLQTNASMRLW